MADRSISVQILGDSRSLENAFKRGSKAGQKFNISIGTLIKSAVVFRAVREGLDAVGRAVSGSISEFSQQQKVAAQTNAVLKSTAGIANVTVRRVDKLANSIQRYSGIDDEAVKAGENLILTFKNVRNEAGKGNAVFDRATKSAVDLSVAGFGSLESTSKQLGKALNDPVKGMTALSRAGVTFSQGQKDTIKQLVETGRTLEAQKLILREVESQVGGSAKAFGETIPGALARTSEAFKNMGGAIVGAVAPAVAGLAQTVADVLPEIERQVAAFVDRLQDAGTLRAKLEVVIATVGDIAKQLSNTIGKAVSRVDWDDVWAQARDVGDALQERLEQIDFGFIGKRIGDGIASAVRVAIPAAKDLAERISNAIGAIDFEELGKKLGPGLAAAVVSAFVTLADPAFWVRNWDLALAVAATVFRAKIVTFAGKLLAPLAKLGGDIVLRIGVGMLDAMPRLGGILIAGLARLPALAAKALSPLTSFVARRFERLGKLARFVVTVLGVQAAINAVVGFAKRVGEVFSNLGSSIAGALKSAWDAIIRQANQAALQIIEPFTHLPSVFGDRFREAKEAMQAQLKGMELAAATTASTIQGSINSIQGRTIEIAVTTTERVRRGQAAGAAQSGSPLTTLSKAAGKIAETEARKVAAETTALATRIAAAEKATAAAIAKQRVAAARAAKAAATAAEKALEDSRDAFASLVDSLSLAFDRAQATKGLRDDLKVATQQITAIQNQIRVEGKTTDLLRQLFDARQQRVAVQKQIAERKTERRQTKQFDVLGLGAGGEKRIPGVEALSKRLSNLRDQVKGTVLDTPKTRAQLANIGKVLSSAFGKVGADVRSAILQMFNDIAGALKGGADKVGPQTKGSAISTKKFLAGLGLSEEKFKAVRGRLSRLGPGGLPKRSLGGAFGQGIPAVSAAGGGGNTFVFNGDIVTPSPDAFMREVERRTRRNSGQRRGTRAGKNQGGV